MLLALTSGDRTNEADACEAEDHHRPCGELRDIGDAANTAKRFEISDDLPLVVDADRDRAGACWIV